MNKFISKTFSELSITELYKILQLRAMVFVVEQDCPYQDVDDYDQSALHIMHFSPEERLIAYDRILPPGEKFMDKVCISRVVTHPEYRRMNLGRELVQSTIEKCHEIFPEKDIQISAQLYLKEFYESFGFEKISEVYLEDNIPHVAMILKVN